MDYFIGVDVSKKTLDLAILKKGHLLMERQLENKPESIRLFLKDFKRTQQVSLENIIVCMEYTGVYNAIALNLFWRKGMKIYLEPAARIQKSLGIVRGKNDKIDARRIALYILRNYQALSLWKPHRLSIQKLQALLSLRDRLIKVKNQLEVPLKESIGLIDKTIIKALDRCTYQAVKGIRKDLKTVDQQIEERVYADTAINKHVQQLTSIPGIGMITAANMIIYTNEFTRITEAKKFACYAGVAPFEHRSGTSIRGKTRVSKLAKMNMKALLHLAAMSAIQCNAEIKAFYTRKVGEGKNKMSVINAVRNKLIARVFACVKNNRSYQENYKHLLA